MSATAEPDALLVDSVERLLSDCATPSAVEDAERDGWSAPIWDSMASAGFPWVSVPEAAGGAGGSLVDAMAVLRAVGRHAAPVPIAETGVLGGWLAAAAGVEVPSGPISVVDDAAALAVHDGMVSGQAIVAWGRRAERIMALVVDDDGPAILALRPEHVVVSARANMAGEPRDLVQVDAPLAACRAATAPPGVDAESLRLRACLTRIVLCAGALESMSQMTVDYTNSRRQFGRPVAAFQAVQQHLVVAAQCSVRASMAADVAVRAVSAGDGRFEVAAARTVVDEAVVAGTRAAHQAHGAMGVTREYPLQQLTRRLWSWRHEHGPAAAWRRQIGATVVAAGADALWPTISV